MLSFVLDTDASSTGIGAVLSQQVNGQERVVAYFSRALKAPERHYCVTRKELLAMVKQSGTFMLTCMVGSFGFALIIQLFVGC